MKQLVCMIVCGVLGASSSATAATACDLASASPWITRWFQAWELTSREILKLPDGPPPNVVFYDSACVYTTSGVTVPGAASTVPRCTVRHSRGAPPHTTIP